MTDLANEELIKAIERYRIENHRSVFELNRRWGKSVSQQVQIDKDILDSLMYSVIPSAGSIAIAGTPPATPIWRRKYGDDWVSAAVTGWEQVMAVITDSPSKGVNMITEQELTDMRLFEDSGFFNSAQIKLITNRTREQWTSSVDEFAHVCFTSNGGAFAFVIVRKNESGIHSRVFGCPNDRIKTGELFREERTITTGRSSLIQSNYTGLGASRLRLPYSYDDVIGSTTWTDGFNGTHASSDIAEEVFNDYLACFKQAELEGMIQNLSIIGTCPEYSGALSKVKAPVIKLMDLELF